VTLELLSIVVARKHTPRPSAPPPEVFPSAGVPWANTLPDGARENNWKRMASNRLT